MCTQLFDPKVDYVFKNIFGSEKHPRILISFLNACIKPKDPIVEVKLKNTEMTREYIEDSFSRLDILAKTSIGESDLLSVWVGFLEDPNNEKVIYLERKVEELQEAKEELARISRDPKEAENYRMRENARNDRLNALLSAEEKGLKKGIQQGLTEGERKVKLEIAKSLKGILSDEIISEKTDLSLEEIKSL